MAKMRFTRFAAVAAATALALTACADRGGDPVETPSDESGSNVEPGVFPQESGGDPVSGGRLTYADFGEARSLDPTVTGPTAAQGATSLVAIYDQLMRWNVEAGKFEAQLAESVIANDDFTEWTITLRPDVNFTDGTPLNADAVIGSMEY